MKTKIAIVGNPEAFHIGAYFYNAAKKIGLDVFFCDVREAQSSNWVANKFTWKLCDKRPIKMFSFSIKVLELCKINEPTWLLCTGIVPLDNLVLEKIGALGVVRVNYLTDDPWNPSHKRTWFLKSLPEYDHIYSVRKANIEDLKNLGCCNVEYLPFAYSPESHYSDPPKTQSEKDKYKCDIIFVGGADSDRRSVVKALLKLDINIHLYGSYWSRYPEFKHNYKGFADQKTMRKAIGGGKINLGLVRKANRDGNSMRTFEAPAIGACMLFEDTIDHRTIFGSEGKAALYFKNADEAIEKVKYLMSHPKERDRLKKEAWRIITQGENTYKDRLQTIINSS